MQGLKKYMLLRLHEQRKMDNKNTMDDVKSILCQAKNDLFYLEHAGYLHFYVTDRCFSKGKKIFWNEK